MHGERCWELRIWSHFRRNKAYTRKLNQSKAPMGQNGEYGTEETE